MTDRKRAGFTLVELLVVMVIIAMLVGLLVPAVIRAREAARRAKCINNQHEISKAMLGYDMINGHLPGVINGVGPVTVGTTWRLSWVTILLPGLGQETTWASWNLAAQNGTAPSTINLPLMVCPSTDVVAAGLNYVVNCGSSDTSPAFIVNSGNVPVQSVNEVSAGVILDYYNLPYNAAGTGTTASMPRMTSANIKDGASQTLMLSENLQTGNWMGGNQTTSSVIGNPNPWDQTVAYNLVGMFWSANPTSNTAPLGINVGRTDTKSSLSTTFPPIPTDFTHARPSSNHPGVVVVTYCDGHQATLSEEISYAVYQQLMAPDDATAWGPALINQPAPNQPLPSE
jgi:prepilin-type N-terminal cleavage/methylation domain-containing protein